MKTSLPLHQSNGASVLSNFQAEVVAIGDVRLPKRVPKKLSDKAVQAMMRAISRTSQQILPVLVDGHSRIVAGFEILAAMKELGARKIGVVRISNLTEAEIKAITLLLARVPDRSDWDEAAVGQLLQEIMIEDPDAIDLTGLEVAEVDLAIEGLALKVSELEPESKNDNDSWAEVDAQNLVVKAGDAFRMDGHRVLCGNCLETATYVSVMGDAKASTCLTDPPYNIPIAGHVTGLGKAKHCDFAMGVGELDFDQFTAFLAKAIGLATDHLNPGGLIYVFMDRRHLEELFRAVRNLGLTIVDLAVWNKLSGGMGSFYRSQHEPCLIARRGDGPILNNIQLGKFGRYRTNVWDHRGNSAFGRDRMEALAAHPTVKPWRLLAELILDCSARGDVILDPFLGSGSTLLAAEKTGRRCFGIELEPRYIEITIARWEKMTGGKAIHEATGLTLDELRSARQPARQLRLPPPRHTGGAEHGEL